MNDQRSCKNATNAPLPTGLMLALAQNMHAMADYAKLSDAARERLIDQASRVQSREEMQTLVRNLGQFIT
jgi:hypothetical protein